MTSDMGIIHVLPLSVVNKIAAGEVIERPASVLKELVENSLDAGARAVKITVEDGGKQLIRITDDGSGIWPDDLPLAFASHATSKLERPDDLFRVCTLGFRGEALASIGSISHARIASRRRGELQGMEIECRGGELDQPRPVGCPEGTTIEVRNLFFNTPARRKFLKSTPVEFGHCVDMVTRFAIAHCDRRFDLVHNGSAIFTLPENQYLKQRVENFLGPEVADALMQLKAGDGTMSVVAYVAPPYLARASAKMQFIFLNGRHIRERVVTRALAQAYKGFIPHDRFPVAILFVTTDPAEVDVNVHPTKIEVRFRNVWRLHDLIVDSVRGLLGRTESAVRLQPGAFGSVAQASRLCPSKGDPESFPPAPAPPSGFRASTPGPADTQEDVKSAILDFFLGHKGELMGRDHGWEPPRDDAQAGAATPAVAAGERPALATPEAGKAAPLQSESLWAQGSGSSATRHGGTATAAPTAPDQAPAGLPATTDYVAPRLDEGRTHLCFQLHDSYIVEETPDGVLIIDQHALHERILIYAMRRRLARADGRRQRMLIPTVVEFSRAEMAIMKETLPFMAQLGFEVDEFGPGSIAVHAVPDVLASSNPETLLRGVVEEYEGGGKGDSAERALDQIINLLSCKAAIKAGERLTHEEMVALLRQREEVEQTASCAHGRPTTLKISLAELRKYFERAVK
ncbi:MAG: DNA mismatch repair endonuclease MutL [Planctomycetota bacterium]|nr:DNA mismatch repair endonuclease MutL [Planctomycetota bacterium]